MEDKIIIKEQVFLFVFCKFADLLRVKMIVFMMYLGYTFVRCIYFSLVIHLLKMIHESRIALTLIKASDISE